MKKLYMLLLAFSIVLTACGNNEKKVEEKTTGKQTETAVKNQEEKTYNHLIETEKYSANIGEAIIEDELLIIPIDYTPKTEDSQWMFDLKLAVIQNGKELEQDLNYDSGIGSADQKKPSLKYAYKGAQKGEATIKMDDKETVIIIK